jgi:hypothetical protein
MMGKNTPTPVEKQALHKAAEQLYRLESSNTYYASLKQVGKQFSPLAQNQKPKTD